MAAEHPAWSSATVHISLPGQVQFWALRGKRAREATLAEIIESARDPVAHRLARSRQLRRFVLPALLVLAIAVGAIGSSYYAQRANRLGARDIAQNYIDVIAARVRTRVDLYLDPAVEAASVLAAAMRSDTLERANLRVFDRISRKYLEAHSYFANVYIGASDGGFVMTSRAPDGNWSRKTVTQLGDQRIVRLEKVDRDGKILEARDDPADPYDPRTRPWYKGAAASPKPFWTPVYRFFSDKSLGLTVAESRSSETDGTLVAGIDIRLTDIEQFLNGLDLGKSGIAMIIDEDGAFIAAPERALAQLPNGADRLKIGDVDDPLLNEIYSRFLIERDYRGLVPLDDSWYMVSFSSLAKTVGRNWWLIFVIPESDFISFVETSNRYTMGAAVAVSVLGCALLAMVVYQSIKAERVARALERDRAGFERAERAYGDLSRAVESAARGSGAIHSATELAAQVTGARRVGVWRLKREGLRLECLDIYDAEARSHGDAPVVEARDFPGYFEVLLSGQPAGLVAPGDPLAKRVGCLSLHSEAVVTSGSVEGAVWIEDPGALSPPMVNPIVFGNTMASLLASAVAERDDAAPVRGPVQKLEFGTARLEASEADALSPVEERRAGAIRRGLGRRGIDASEIAPVTFPALAVATVHFHDPIALGAHAQDGDETLFHKVVTACGRAENGAVVGHFHLSGQSLILADDGAGDPGRAAERVADVALKLHDAINVAAGQQRGFGFAIGIDLGPAFGAGIGGDGALNLWGEAPDVSASLAAAARDRTIEASEAVYNLLRERYQFRRRGAFFLADVGEVGVYLLRGRQ